MATSPSAPGRRAGIERVNVNFPRPLLDDLRRLVPRSRRSEVIARATAHEVRRLKLAALFQDLGREAAWRAEDHQGLAAGPSIDSWVSRMRSQGGWPGPESTHRRKAARE